MPRNFLLDTNVLLDAILGRSGADDSRACLLLFDRSSDLIPWIAPHGLATIYYLARREIGKDAIEIVLRKLLQSVRLAPLDEISSLKAFDYGMSDYEDALQSASADVVGAEAVISRNIKDFTNSPVPALTPDEFIAKLEKESSPSSD